MTERVSPLKGVTSCPDFSAPCPSGDSAAGHGPWRCCSVPSAWGWPCGSFFLQVRTDGFYADRAQGQQLRDTVVPADRGRIYSADGLLLAANSSCWTLRASPREMPEEKIALAAHGLAEILALDEAALLEKFSDRRSNDCLLRYRVDRAAADAVRDFCEENRITGIRINQDSKRWYPQGAFLASVLGFTNVDNAGGWPGWN